MGTTSNPSPTIEVLRGRIEELARIRQGFAMHLGASLYEATKNDEGLRWGREPLYDGISACDAERDRLLARIDAILASEAAVEDDLASDGVSVDEAGAAEPDHVVEQETPIVAEPVPEPESQPEPEPIVESEPDPIVESEPDPSTAVVDTLTNVVSVAPDSVNDVQGDAFAAAEPSDAGAVSVVQDETAAVQFAQVELTVQPVQQPVFVETACPSCGSPVRPTDKFCMECGAPLSAFEQGLADDQGVVANVCPNCGSPTEPSYKFCMVCGHKLR